MFILICLLKEKNCIGAATFHAKESASSLQTTALCQSIWQLWGGGRVSALTFTLLPRNSFAYFFNY